MSGAKIPDAIQILQALLAATKPASETSFSGNEKRSDEKPSKTLEQARRGVLCPPRHDL